ncbi:hypothetical protein FRC10_009078 [Ceratobasidium sp. 414]|nr:hypothetical protein FRC10_009078 [Ceratobasidium sp. 414]
MACETLLEQWENLVEVFSERTGQGILTMRTKLSQMHWDLTRVEPLQAFLQSMVANGTELARVNHPVSLIDMCSFIAMAMPKGLQQLVSTLKRIGRLTPESWIRDLTEDEKVFKLHKPGAVAKVNRAEASEHCSRPQGECWKCCDWGQIQKYCPTISEEECHTLQMQYEDRQHTWGNGRVAVLEGKLSMIKARALVAGVTFNGDDTDASLSPRIYSIRACATPSTNTQPPADEHAEAADHAHTVTEHITFTSSADDGWPVLLTHAKAATALNESIDPGLVILDSGCTHHVSSDRGSLINYRPLAAPRKVTVADKGTVDTIGVGDLCVWTCTASGKDAMTMFKDTLHVLFFVDHCKVWGADHLEVQCEFVNELYVLKRVLPPLKFSSSVSPTHLFLLHTTKAKAVTVIHPEVAHWCLSHLNMNDVWHIAHDELLTGFDIQGDHSTGTCEPCLLGKARHLLFGFQPHCDVPLLVHSDVIRPFDIETTGHAHYFVTFRDDHMQVGNAYLSRNKLEALDKFKEWRAWAERLLQLHVQGFHSDNRGKYIGNEFKSYLRDNNIEYSQSHTHMPQENGLAERYNRVILSIMHTTLQESGLPSRFWGAAVRYAAYTINFRLSAVLDGAIPMALWTRSTLDASHLWSFGCDTYCYILPGSAHKKLKPTAVKCQLTGYMCTRYRVWDPESRRCRESKHVVCIKLLDGKATELVPLLTEEALARAYNMTGPGSDGWEHDALEATHCHPDPPDLVEEVLQLPSDDIPLEEIPVNIAPEEPANEEDTPEPGFEGMPGQAEPMGPCRSGRVCQQPARLRDMVPSDQVEHHHQAKANTARPQTNLEPLDIPAGDPKNLREVLASNFANRWLEAAAQENQVLTEMETFEVVEDLPPGAKAIGCQYAFKYKPADNVFKARLVTQGFSQCLGINFALTFSPVTKSPSVRLVYSLAVLHNLHLFTADFVSTFLNGTLKEEIYL